MHQQMWKAALRSFALQCKLEITWPFFSSGRKVPGKPRAHRSVSTDCHKLHNHLIAARKLIVIYSDIVA